MSGPDRRLELKLLLQEHGLSKEAAAEAVKRLEDNAREWVTSLSDEEAAEIAERHDLLGGAHHLRKLSLLKYRKAMQREGNTEAVALVNHTLKWFEENRY